ncbi:MAG: hypothetical protein OEZ59_00795 [Deltaproteobacteria bacterium]|nr:hypothetical protein [Deltaproteobacteria bacterium]
MSPSKNSTEKKSTAELQKLKMEYINKLASTYRPGLDRVITPENVFQEAVTTGRDVLEELQHVLFLPGSGVQGLENLDDCLAEIQRGKSVLFMPEHRGNFDVPSFNALLRCEDSHYHEVLDRLIYVAGRKLNESSDLVKMFSEKYARLIIVPRREYPQAADQETEEQRQAREEFEKTASRINRAAFREMLRLKKQGRIFVLFPMGGRLKEGHHNRPVREAASYLETFDSAYLISMDGNALPPLSRMEDEVPMQDKVVFRVGPRLDTAEFLGVQRKLFADLQAKGDVSPDMDAEMFTMERVMQMLENLRLTGRYES